MLILAGIGDAATSRLFSGTKTTGLCLCGRFPSSVRPTILQSAHRFATLTKPTILLSAPGRVARYNLPRPHTGQGKGMDEVDEVPKMDRRTPKTMTLAQGY